jgi:hypothetical protein
VKDASENSGSWKERKEGLEEIYKAFSDFRRKRGTDWKAIHKDALEWYGSFADSNPIRGSKHYSWMDERGVYFPDNISGPNFGQYRYEVIHPVTGLACKEPSSGWRYPEETMKTRIAEGLVHFGDDHTTVPNNKTYLKKTELQSFTSIKYRDGRVASKLIGTLFGEKKPFANPKDVDISSRLLSSVGSAESMILDFFAGSGTTGHAVINLNREDNGQRKYLLIEMGEYFDTILVPRLKKVVYSTDWKEGKPQTRNTGVSHAFKIIRLEGYEDTLNNLHLRRTPEQEATLTQSGESNRGEYLLGYFLDVESAGSASLLDVSQFRDPFAYKLNIATSSAGETRETTVDLVETFNWLLGLKVKHIDTAKGFLTVTGEKRAGGRCLILWRTLSPDSKADNESLDKFLTKLAVNPADTEYDFIYLNGPHTVNDPHNKVHLIEETFQRLMFDTTNFETLG